MIQLRRGIIELMPFVSITRLRVRFWRDVPRFLIQSFRSARQAKCATGNLAVSVLRDTHRAFWIHTVWRNEARHALIYALRRAPLGYGAAPGLVR